MENYCNQNNYVSEARIRAVFKRTYLYMVAALVISGGLAYVVASSMSEELFVLCPICVVLEFIVLIAGSVSIRKRKTGLAKFLFFFYSVLNGASMSYIFIIYDLGSVTSIFFVTAITFAVLAIIGSVTKKDLTTIGRVGLMALIGVIVASIVNIFVGSSVLDLGITILGLALFIGITAYDAQKIKKLAMLTDMSIENIALFGAFELYLDFVNIFIRLLSLFGGGRISRD